MPGAQGWVKQRDKLRMCVRCPVAAFSHVLAKPKTTCNPSSSRPWWCRCRRRTQRRRLLAR